MRRPALFLLVATGCSFDASGFGEPPATSNATLSPGTGSTGGDSSGGSEPTTSETGAGPGSGSQSGSSSSGEVTTEPATTDPGTATTGGTTAGTTAPETTGPGTSSTTEPCETMNVYVDADGDTYGDPNKPAVVCAGEWDGVANNGDDCNDAAMTAHPGADEICDTLDNDCDGSVDEYDEQTNKDKCGECYYRIRDQRLYMFCQNDSNWDVARGFCMTRKLDLAIDSDDGEHKWMVDRKNEFGPWDRLWWLSARENSGWKWAADGSTVPNDARWGLNQPDNLALDFSIGADCAGIWADKWFDDDCGEGRDFICEGPIP